MAKTLDFSRVFVWCGKQDLNCPIALKIMKISAFSINLV